MRNDEPMRGETVEIPWGPLHRVRATVRDVFGSSGDRRVVVVLSPEVSGTVVSEPTTSSWPLSDIWRVPAVRN